MEENNQNAMIKTAFGVVITLVVVGLILTLVFKVMPTINNANKKVDNLSAQMDTMYYANYNNATVSGSEVIAAINTKANSECKVTVKTGNGTATYDSASYNVTNPNAQNYIEQSAKFSSTLNKSSNGSIIGITFNKQK